MFGIDFPVAVGLLTRSRGLSLVDREQAGPGLFIPRCRSVHTFGMRFTIDVFFLDSGGNCLSVRCGVPPGRIVLDLRAHSVLETWAGLVPSHRSGAVVFDGGEKGRPRT